MLSLYSNTRGFVHRFFVSTFTFLFLTLTVIPGEYFSMAQAAGKVNLPPPQEFIELTAPLRPPCLKGIQLFPSEPLTFDFMVDEGDASLSEEEFRSEVTKLVKYFLAALTIPDEELWVNLSPFEKDKVATEALGLTEMGKDLLGADYILKQLFASLTYPEGERGRTFWDTVYEKARAEFGTTNIPISTFNKIWIVPAKAVIYEGADSVLVGEARLKVMLEEDYLALKNNMHTVPAEEFDLAKSDVEKINDVSSSVVREIVLPAIEEEVNYGENFAIVRQVYSALVLATWFKQKLKESIVNKVYSDKKKLKGVDLDDPNTKQAIYEQYMEAYRTGVYNYIKKDYDSASRKYIKRKYASGGMDFSSKYMPQAFDIQPMETLAVAIIPAAASSGISMPDYTLYESRIAALGTLSIPGAKIDIATAALNNTTAESTLQVANAVAWNALDTLSVRELEDVFAEMGQDNAGELAQETKVEFTNLREDNLINNFEDFTQMTKSGVVLAPNFTTRFARATLRTFSADMVPQRKADEVMNKTLTVTFNTLPQQDLNASLAPFGAQAADIAQDIGTIRTESAASAIRWVKVKVQFVPTQVAQASLAASSAITFTDYASRIPRLRTVEPTSLTISALQSNTPENANRIADTAALRLIEASSTEHIAFVLSEMDIGSDLADRLRIARTLKDEAIQFQKDVLINEGRSMRSFNEFAQQSSFSFIRNEDFARQFSTRGLLSLPASSRAFLGNELAPVALANVSAQDLPSLLMVNGVIDAQASNEILTVKESTPLQAPSSRITTRSFDEYAARVPELRTINPIRFTQSAITRTTRENQRKLAGLVTMRVLQMMPDVQVDVVLNRIGQPSGLERVRQIKDDIHRVQLQTLREEGRVLNDFNEYATRSSLPVVRQSDFAERFAFESMTRLADTATGYTLGKEFAAVAIETLGTEDLRGTLNVQLETESADIAERITEIKSQPAASSAFAAAERPRELGGIDLSPENFEIEVQGEGLRITYLDTTFDIENLEGFTFTILEISGI